MCFGKYIANLCQDLETVNNIKQFSYTALVIRHCLNAIRLRLRLADCPPTRQKCNAKAIKTTLSSHPGPSSATKLACNKTISRKQHKLCTNCAVLKFKCLHIFKAMQTMERKNCVVESTTGRSCYKALQLMQSQCFVNIIINNNIKTIVKSFRSRKYYSGMSQIISLRFNQLHIEITPENNSEYSAYTLHGLDRQFEMHCAIPRWFAISC